NLRCKLCNFWQNRDPLSKLDIASKLHFLTEFISWQEKKCEEYQKSFSIILNGGEPFLYSNQVFKVAKFCKDNDISCFINTNGSLIDSELRKILRSGLTALTISIDSHKAEIHDGLRGFSGLFNHLIKLIKKLNQQKRKKRLPINICIQSILGNWNITHLRDHINFFSDLGIDGIMFQPIQYPFGLLIPKNWHNGFTKFPQSSKDIKNGIDLLLKLKQNNGFLMNSMEEIEMWRDYYRNPEFIKKIINPCKAYEQNLIVDVCGNVKFCFNKDLEPENKIGNILTTSIYDIWEGQKALQEKEEMRNCTRACGVMACHIDTSLRVG
ncbi:MAG: radical SAM protein, partial [Promethearchaeota archaeon]